MLNVTFQTVWELICEMLYETLYLYNKNLLMEKQCINIL